MLAIRPQRGVAERHGDIREQQQALQLDPGIAVAHVELAAVQVRKPSGEDAARECREAIRLKPGYADAHRELGDALGHLGEWRGQITEEKTALRRAPSLAIAHFWLALEKEGQTAEALQEYHRAAEFALKKRNSRIISSGCRGRASRQGTIDPLEDLRMSLT